MIDETPLRKRRKWLFRAVILLTLIAVLEVGSFVALTLLGRKYPMDPMAGIQPERVEALLGKYYDPDLGWTYDRAFEGGGELNSIHARSTHEYRDLWGTISVYGDSYAFGMDVPIEDAWPTLLEKEAGIGVLNFGVPSYGTDQALLRLEKQHGRVPSATVLLCVLTENINRCVNVYGGFYRPESFVFKPRFVLQDGRLEVFNPFSNVAEARDILLTHPDRLIAIAKEHDHWYQELELFGRPWSIEPPYSLQLAVRIPYCLRRLQGGISDVGLHVPLYKEGTESLEIMKRIMSRFRDFAAERRFKGLVVIFPRIRDVRTMVATGEVGYQTLRDHLTAEEIPYIDLVEVLADQPDVSSLYVRGLEHMTRAGGEIIVPEVLRFLEQEDALPGG